MTDKVLSGKIVTTSGVFAGRIEFDHDIKRIVPSNEDLREPIIVPGFVDCQINGAGGADFLTDGVEGMDQACRTCLAHGTTSFLPTLITSDDDLYLSAMSAIQKYIDRSAYGAAGPLGVHLEGPFLNPARAGVHPPHMRSVSIDWLRDLHRIARVKMITVAPEMDGAMRFIEDASALGLVVQIGHSDATFEQAQAALSAGASGFTHVFNAMSPMHHRKPGVTGAALAGSGYGQIIVDFLHVHEAVLKVAFSSNDKFYCVTDSTSAAGMPDGIYSLGGVRIQKRNNTLRDENGNLAGSCLTMDQVFRNLLSLGMSLEGAVAKTAQLPARHLGLSDRGHISVGARADLIVLDVDCHVQDVYVGGRRYGELL